LRKRVLANNSKIQQLDSNTVYPNSLKVFCGKLELSNNEYVVDYTANMIQFFSTCADSLTVTFRVLPMNLAKSYQRRDTNIIYNQSKGDLDKFKITTTDTYSDIFGSSGIKKNGSISRGISLVTTKIYPLIQL
jgi:hypothetical protein